MAANLQVIVAVGALIAMVVLFTYDRSLGIGDAEHARAMAMVSLTVASSAVTIVLHGLRTRAAQAVPLAAITFARRTLAPPVER